jgi:hypothetical protein
MLTLYFLHRTAQLPQSFNFLTQLRSFSFDCNSWDGSPNDGVQFVVRALRHLASPYLWELNITLSSVGCDLLDCDVWCELGSLLETHRFLPALRMVVFRFLKSRQYLAPVGPEAATARELWIAERFPMCASRGILHVHQGGG